MTPEPETVTAVNKWLSANGLKATVLSPFGDWIGFETTASHAIELFDAEFSAFVHDGSGKRANRTLAYSIPASLKDHLQLVHPTITCVICPILRTASQDVLTSSAASHLRTTLDRLSSPAKIVPAGNLISADEPTQSCDILMTPRRLQRLPYYIPRENASPSSNKLAVSGFLEEFANNADLRVCAKQVTPSQNYPFRNSSRLPPGSIPRRHLYSTLQTIDGGIDRQDPFRAGTVSKL